MNESNNFYQDIYSDRLRDGRKTYSRLGIAVVVLFLVFFGVSMIFAYGAYYLFPGMEEQWWFDWVCSIVPLYAFALPAYMLCLRGVEKGAHDPNFVSRGYIYEKPKFHFGHFALFLVVGWGLTYIGSFIGQGLMTLLSNLTGYDYENTLSSSIENSPTWIVFLCTVIIAPIGEEFIFRKLFIDRARRYGDGVAILMSGLLFGLFHGNFFQFFYAFMLGIIMAYMYTYTGKLYWPVGMHMFINLMGSVVMPGISKLLKAEELSEIMEKLDPMDTQASLDFFVEYGTEYALLTMISLLMYALMFAAVAILICWFCMRKVRLGKGEAPLRSGDGFIAVFCNVGIPLCLVLLCLLMLINLIPAPMVS